MMVQPSVKPEAADVFCQFTPASFLPNNFLLGKTRHKATNVEKHVLVL
jgi:hypothetical protein